MEGDAIIAFLCDVFVYCAAALSWHRRTNNSFCYCLFFSLLSVSLFRSSSCLFCYYSSHALRVSIFVLSKIIFGQRRIWQGYIRRGWWIYIYASTRTSFTPRIHMRMPATYFWKLSLSSEFRVSPGSGCGDAAVWHTFAWIAKEPRVHQMNAKHKTNKRATERHI